jgi:hypothetical protein
MRDWSLTRQRWESWVWTCIFALLPLLLWLLLVQIIGVEGKTGAAEASRELLFFSIAISTFALSGLRDANSLMRRRPGYESLFQGCLVVIAGSAASYGVFLTVHSQPKLVARTFAFAIGIALVGFTVGTLTQLFIHNGDSNEGADC